MERMDILAGQQRLIVREIKTMIEQKKAQFNTTKDWNFQLCDLEFDIF